MENKRLIFVYNADGDVFSTVTDFAHKIISPKTYACSLCSLTYGNFGIKKDWAEYIKTVQPSPEFLHKDEFIKKYSPSGVIKYPVVVTLKDSIPEIFISDEELNAAKSLDDLKKLIAEKSIS
jgi:hypothetical protein